MTTVLVRTVIPSFDLANEQGDIIFADFRTTVVGSAYFVLAKQIGPVNMGRVADTWNDLATVWKNVGKPAPNVVVIIASATRVWSRLCMFLCIRFGLFGDLVLRD